MVRGYAYALGGATQVQDMRIADPSTHRSPNVELFSRVWGVSVFAHLVIGIATLVLLSAMGIWSAAPLIADTGTGELWVALAAFILGGAIRAYGGLHVSYLMGIDRIPLLRWWETCFWLLAFVAALSVLLLGGGLLEIAIGYQIPLCLNIVWNAWLCRRDQNNRAGFVSRIRVDREVLAQLWPSIWRTGLGTTLFIGATQGAGLYYATVGEAQDVAAFLFAMSIIRPLGQFAQVPFMTKLPRLARLQAEGERGAQRKIAERSMMLSYALHAFMVIGVALALPIVPGLRGSEVQVPILLWLLIGIAGYIERMGSMHLQLYATTNHVLLHWANGLAAAVFLGLAAVLLPTLEVYAFPVGHMIALVMIYCPIGMINSYRSFRLNFPIFEMRTSLAPVTVLLLSLMAIKK